MIFTAILFLTAFALSAVAAYYSIIGLIAIFPTAFIPIAVMGITLEIGKLVSASWLYRNWKDSPKLLKYYFTTAVVILSFITSMGVFGFLSKAHLDQTLAYSGSDIELKVLEQQIQSEQRKIDNAQRSITALDRLVDQSDTEAAIKLRNSQAGERKQLFNQISSSNTIIKDLNTKAMPLRKESKKVAAEVGPIKYIADVIYGDSTEGTLEKAVRAVILLIVFVFDPLAIILLIAANRELSKLNMLIVPPKEELLDGGTYGVEDSSKVTLDKSKIYEIPQEILDKVFKSRK